jgi:AraC-like DNA-binding protein
LPVGEALAAAGLEESSLEGPETRVPHAANNLLWGRLAACSGDPDFGLHFAERLTLDAFDVLGHLVVRSDTFGQGLARVVACSRILHDAGRIETERRGADLVIYPGCRGLTHEVPRHISEFSAASVLVLGRIATGVSMRARAVRFRHGAPASLPEHLRIFGVTPTFDAPETEVVLDASVLDLRVLDAQPGLLTFLDAYARDVVARLPQGENLASQVERQIAAAMPRGVPEIEAIARQLGLSPRTLQRRLADEELSFQTLVDGVRRSYAERFLAEGRLSIGEIAFLVGFSDPSNFHRAFRRWTGKTPAAHREEHRSTIS